MNEKSKIKIIKIKNNIENHVKLKEINIKRVYSNYLDRKIQEFERQAFLNVISERITEAQAELFIIPPKIYADEINLLAIHWHPEFLPLDLIIRRIDNTFPNAVNKLIIPTQHNKLMNYDGFTGVEVDCFSPEFNRKVQLLLHFGRLSKSKSKKLSRIIEHTFNYRSKQLFELLETLAMQTSNNKIKKAITVTGVGKEVVDFVKIQSGKLITLLNENIKDVPPLAKKNKLVRNYLDELINYYGIKLVKLSQIYIKAVKDIVKAEFDNSYFYNTRELIEEARFLNAGIVIPHPEQFWPILLAGYDVDGYEVWNPQSREYTEFLMQVVLDQNKTRKYKNRPILVFMGDDTHLGEKVRPEVLQDHDKSIREVGVQPAWADPDIQKILIETKFSKEKLINEYRERLKQ
jgi:hypothetical protein